jgi:Domain of unknown function (DUF6748)
MKSLLAVASLAALTAAACAAPTESAADSSEDELRAVHAEGYFEVRPDLRACVSPMCGGLFVRLLNQDKTACAGGEAKDACYVATVDTSALHLPESLASRIAAGANVIVKGQLRDKAYDRFGNLGVLVASEAFVAGDAGDTTAHDSRFYLVKTEQVECVRAPCPELFHETLLNTKGDGTTVGALDLDQATVSPDEEELVHEAAAEGIIVLGHNDKNGMVASKYFVKATPAAGLNGSWGADGALLTVAAGKGRLQFSCGTASIDGFRFVADTSFTATGTHLAGSGVPQPPEKAPKPVPATFKGTLDGDNLTLEMTVDGQTTSSAFIKGRDVRLVRCL